MTAGTRYDFELLYTETNGGAYCKLSWETVSFPKEIVPASAFSLGKKRVGDLTDVVMAPLLSVPVQSEVTPEGPLTIIAGDG